MKLSVGDSMSCSRTLKSPAIQTLTMCDDVDDAIDDQDAAVEATIRHTANTLEARESDDETPMIDEWRPHAVDPRDHHRKND